MMPNPEYDFCVKLKARMLACNVPDCVAENIILNFLSKRWLDLPADQNEVWETVNQWIRHGLIGKP